MFIWYGVQHRIVLQVKHLIYTKIKEQIHQIQEANGILEYYIAINIDKNDIYLSCAE